MNVSYAAERLGFATNWGVIQVTSELPVAACFAMMHNAQVSGAGAAAGAFHHVILQLKHTLMTASILVHVTNLTLTE
jgi:hypothetical protein